MTSSRFQPHQVLGEILDEYILAERHPRLEQITQGTYLDGKYWVGYRYLDLSAGPSVNVETFCVLDDAGRLIKQQAPIDYGNRWVFRSGVMDDLPAVVLNEQQLRDLGLPPKPDWLRFYEKEEESPNLLFQKGRALNGGGLCEQSIPSCSRL